MALFEIGKSLFDLSQSRPDSVGDINAELARLDALYAAARAQGTAAITQDYQAQRGELAQSQAARGILRSGVSQLGLARLGAGREQALAAYNAQLSAAQAGGQSSILNALMGRKARAEELNAERRRQSINQIFGSIGGAIGSYYGGAQGGQKGYQSGQGWGERFQGQRNQPSNQGGYNFYGSNMVAPPAQQFYLSDFGYRSQLPPYGGYSQPQSPAPAFGGGGGTPFY